MKKIASRIAAAAAFATVAGGAVLAIGGAASAETLPGGEHARTATTASVVKKVESRPVSWITPSRDNRGDSHDTSGRNEQHNNSNQRGADNHYGSTHQDSGKQHNNSNQHGADNHYGSTHQDSSKKTG